jgi:hypothetical protein
VDSLHKELIIGPGKQGCEVDISWQIIDSLGMRGMAEPDEATVP